MNKELVRNASDEGQIKHAKQREKKQRDVELDDVRFILATPQGRRVLWKYMSLCDRISASDSGSWTYFKEGERNVALRIKTDVVEASPDALLLMMKENKGEVNV